MEINLETLLIDIATKAGSLVSEAFGDSSYRHIVRRNVGDVTRRIDQEVEDFVINTLRSEGLRALVLTEESGTVRIGDGEPEYIVVMDPLDGSLNFTLGIPFYSVSIAMGRYRENANFGVLTNGVVNFIPRGVVYYGELNKGFTIRGYDDVSIEEDIDRPVASIYMEPTVEDGVLRNLRNAYEKLGRFKIRSLGSASLEMTMAALGKLLFFMDVRNRLRIFDIAGAYVIAKSSGALAMTLGGNDLSSIPLDLGIRLSVIVTRSVDVARLLLGQ
ncbi:inositol monophosphatase family protein [Vulcanisaeta thermophila]|uniref:inositol monophosphatase family protein n=1 Tax=Vulcanisaeta thermophila TaxID=867917 RepID=UPI0008536638|nr:inositol monophosphatase family protein [Vulcanisaeta thermophila]